MLKIPRTREEAAEIYMRRRKNHEAYLKYDMFLGGLVGCNADDEFYYRIYGNDLSHIYGTCPCLCIYNLSEKCNAHRCSTATQITFNLKWNEDLYKEA